MDHTIYEHTLTSLHFRGKEIIKNEDVISSLLVLVLGFTVHGANFLYLAILKTTSLHEEPLSILGIFLLWELQYTTAPQISRM